MTKDKPNLGALLLVGLALWWLWSDDRPLPFAREAPTVLIVKDTATQSGLPGAMVDSWSAAAILDWTEQHCARDSDGSVAFKVIDKEFELSQLDPKYGELLKKHPPERLPWLYIATGRHGTRGDPRANVADFLAELNKWRPR